MLWLPGSVLGPPGMLLAGAAASVHCSAMCGALSAHHARAAGTVPLATAIGWVHGGRVLGYAAMGGLAGFMGQAILRHLPGAVAGLMLQAAAALALVIIGLRLLLRSAAPTGCCPSRVLTANAGLSTRPLLLLRGALWAAVPCGLLYSVLLLSALSGNGIDGALAAGAFALGGSPLLAAIGWHAARGGSGTGPRRGRGWWLLAVGLTGLAATASLPSAFPESLCKAGQNAVSILPATRS